MWCTYWLGTVDNPAGVKLVSRISSASQRGSYVLQCMFIPQYLVFTIFTMFTKMLVTVIGAFYLTFVIYTISSILLLSDEELLHNVVLQKAYNVGKILACLNSLANPCIYVQKDKANRKAHTRLLHRMCAKSTNNYIEWILVCEMHTSCENYLALWELVLSFDISNNCILNASIEIFYLFICTYPICYLHVRSYLYISSLHADKITHGKF